MTTHPYLHLDVFAARALEGNQLAVFLDSPGLDLHTMQAIAMEMAFPESTFVLPSESPGTDVRMRIFTPARELPMAGHPTVGSAFALAHAGRIHPDQATFVFGLGVGPTPVDLEWQGGRLTFAWMHQQRPTFEPAITDIAELATGLGLPDTEIRRVGLPVQVVSCGLPYVMVPLATREVVDRARPNSAALEAFARGAGLEGIGYFVFSAEAAGDGATAYSRMFAPEFGIVEDPATGSASGPLGCYLVHHRVVARERAGEMISLQGVRMGRPSQIHIAIESADEEITDVKVGGNSIVVGEGTIHLQ